MARACGRRGPRPGRCRPQSLTRRRPDRVSFRDRMGHDGGAGLCLPDRKSRNELLIFLMAQGCPWRVQSSQQLVSLPLIVLSCGAWATVRLCSPLGSSDLVGSIPVERSRFRTLGRGELDGDGNLIRVIRAHVAMASTDPRRHAGTPWFLTLSAIATRTTADNGKLTVRSVCVWLGRFRGILRHYLPWNFRWYCSVVSSSLRLPAGRHCQFSPKLLGPFGTGAQPPLSLTQSFRPA